ncbi:MAG: hypothetical protein H0X34_12480 [Chthoniobacterales bacterium]|nr:hypothetical protein [Chthoniobacterales bacterium]
MKRPALALLLAILALPSCETTHRAAVSTFRVIDAPHAYLRRQLGMDTHDADRTTTTTTTTTAGNVAPNGTTYRQPYQQQPPPPQQYPPQRQVVSAPPPPSRPSQRQVTVTEQTRESKPEATSTPAPRVTSRSSTTSTSNETQAKTSATSPSTTAEKASLPYAKPVPGKTGYVFSPYDKNGGYVDVTGFAPGSKVKDPYSGKVFLVP